MAEVVKFDDLKEAGSENAAKVIFVYFCFHSQIIIAEVLKLEDLKAQGSLNAAKFLLLLCALLVIFILRMRDSYTNPSETKRIESFEIFGLTKRIHETNLWKSGLQNESTIQIF
jgi:hypothetical protein